MSEKLVTQQKLRLCDDLPWEICPWTLPSLSYEHNTHDLSQVFFVRTQWRNIECNCHASSPSSRLNTYTLLHHSWLLALHRTTYLINLIVGQLNRPNGLNVSNDCCVWNALFEYQLVQLIAEQYQLKIKLILK